MHLLILLADVYCDWKFLTAVCVALQNVWPIKSDSLLPPSIRKMRSPYSTKSLLWNPNPKIYKYNVKSALFVISQSIKQIVSFLSEDFYNCPASGSIQGRQSWLAVTLKYSSYFNSNWNLLARRVKTCTMHSCCVVRLSSSSSQTSFMKMAAEINMVIVNAGCVIV